MALSRVKVWIPGDILTASDLNAEFNNLLNNPISLISPTTGAINFSGGAHTGLLPGAITGSSGTTGDVLAIGSGGVGIWTPNLMGPRTIPLDPGGATFSSGLFPSLVKTTDSLWPTYTLLYHSSVKESAYFYAMLTSNLGTFSSASLELAIACTSSGGASVWQVNTKMVNTAGTWNIVGSTAVSSTFTVGAASDITILTIPLAATSWALPGVLQVRIDRTTDAGNTSTGLYLHNAAIKAIMV
jgi:hypothetical protein